MQIIPKHLICYLIGKLWNIFWKKIIFKWLQIEKQTYVIHMLTRAFEYFQLLNKAEW